MSEKKKKRPPLTRAATEVNENTLKALSQCRHPSLYKKNHAKPVVVSDFGATSGVRRIERVRSSVKDSPKPSPVKDHYMEITVSNLARHRSCPHLLDDNDDDDDDHTPVPSDIDEYCSPFGMSSAADRKEHHRQYSGEHSANTGTVPGCSDSVFARGKFSSNQKVFDSYTEWTQGECGGYREGKKQFGEPPFSAKIHASPSSISPTEGMFRFDRISTSVSDNFSDIEEPDSELILEDRVSDSEDQDFPLRSGREGDAKCNQWLQGLQLSQADRLKSRSHLRLPPV